MEEDQREAHFNAWARTKKRVEIEVRQLGEKSWMAKCKDTLDTVVYRDTKADAISAIHDTLTRKGYRISNLLEVQQQNHEYI